MASGYSKNLFKDVGDCENHCLRGAFPTLSRDKLERLGCGFMKEDLFQVVCSMWDFKASGLDGFQTIFYQNQWDIVGDLVYSLISDLFYHPFKVEEINDTLISLIPKVNEVCCMKQFCLISLCNVSYKILTKLIAQHMRTMMESLVDPYQSNFIPHRQSRDNIIVAQEVLHSMRTRKGKRVGWLLRLTLGRPTTVWIAASSLILFGSVVSHSVLWVLLLIVFQPLTCVSYGIGRLWMNLGLHGVCAKGTQFPRICLFSSWNAWFILSPMQLSTMHGSLSSYLEVVPSFPTLPLRMISSFSHRQVLIRLTSSPPFLNCCTGALGKRLVGRRLAFSFQAMF